MVRSFLHFIVLYAIMGLLYAGYLYKYIPKIAREVLEMIKEEDRLEFDVWMRHKTLFTSLVAIFTTLAGMIGWPYFLYYGIRYGKWH